MYFPTQRHRGLCLIFFHIRDIIAPFWLKMHRNFAPATPPTPTSTPHPINSVFSPLIPLLHPMRIITRLIIHCTATPPGREVSAADIRRWHTAPPSKGGRGWKQVGYTDLFHLNGGVERLVNNNEDANVDPWEVTNGVAGYNSVSRHIVYAGGCAKDGKTPADTRTSWQKKALEKYVKDFHRRFPDVRIVGHNELAAKACPSFDVQRWLKQIGIT